MFIKVCIVLLAATAVFGNPTGKIIGGSDAAPGEIVFQVSIQDRDGRHYCGGVIISSNTIITAASCIVDLNIGQSNIVAGTVDKTMGGTSHKANLAVIHPNFTMSGAAGVPHNDIAVVHVNSAFPADENTGKAFMPIQDYDVPAGTVCTASGWGTTSFGGPSPNILQKVDIPTISDEDCTAAYADLFPLNAEMLCAGVPEGGMDACEGDVGGPLFAGGVVYGIFSVGGRCGEPGRPGIYTEVSAFRDWIDENTL